jgi:hypothetical protein
MPLKAPSPSPRSRRRGGADGARVQKHPQRHPPLVARRRGLGSVQITVRVEPKHRDPAMPGGERLDGTDVRAATTAENDRALRKVERKREVLFLQRGLGDDSGFRKVERQPRSLRHCFPAVPPGPRNANEAGSERSPARMALVVAVERNRCVGQAVGTLGAQTRHQRIGFS